MSVTEKFEHYEVQKHADGSLFELGRGAMGITYKAVDTDLQCLVALKIINPSTIANADSEQRFFREARSAAQLRHPNIASVFRLGKTEDGTHYYAMEFCEGQTLQQLIEQSGPLECYRALDFTLQVTKALIVAEERHLVHRDLKPSNLIVTQRSDEGEVIKVIDFGLAKTTAAEGTMWSSMGTHGFIGTAHFASPEQIEDKPVDTRSDIYSLGSTLWFMLLGKPPFEGSLARIMSQHLTAEPDYSRLASLPDKVVALIRRMLQKEASDRPQSALDLRKEIRDCLKSIETPEREWKLTPAGNLHPIQDTTPPVSSPADESGQHREHAPLDEASLQDQPPPSVEPSPAGQGPSEEPSQSEEPEQSGEVWLPSLLDLLRIRGVLAPVEALRLGEELATQLDRKLEAGISEGTLRIQEVAIHFHDTKVTGEIQARLRQHVMEWPAFDLVVTPIEIPQEPENLDPSEMVTTVPGAMTIPPGAVTVGDLVQQLAHLIYELLGGVSGSRYVPLASLGEEGNDVLRRATNLGLAGYPTLRNLIEQLRGTTDGSSLLPIPAPLRPVRPLPVAPARPVTTPPSQPATSPPSRPATAETPPPLLPDTVPPAHPAPVEWETPAPSEPATPEPENPVAEESALAAQPPASAAEIHGVPVVTASAEPEVFTTPPELPPNLPPIPPAAPSTNSPFPSSVPPNHPSEAPHAKPPDFPAQASPQSVKPQAAKPKSSALKKSVLVVGSVFALVGLIFFVLVVMAIMSGANTARKSTSGDYSLSSTPAPTPPRSAQSSSGPLISNSSNPLTGAPPLSTGPGPLVSNSSIPLISPVQFTIFDDLGEGQISETVSVFVDDQETPVGKIVITQQKPHGSLTVYLASGGHHFFSVQAQAVMAGQKKNTRKITANGRWEADFQGGEKYGLSATPSADGSSYQIELTNHQ